jgi:peroxiredoxin
VQKLPLDFTLDDQEGRTWRLSDHLGDSVVLLFLRGDW